MRFCTECGTKNEDHAKFCCACGTALSAEASPPTEPPRPTSDSFPVAAATLPTDLERAYRNAFNIPQNEVIITAIGNDFVQSFLMNGTVQQTVAVATNRRFYYQGRSLVGGNKNKIKLSREIESGSVLVKDIAYTGMKNSSSFLLKIARILSLVSVGFTAISVLGTLFAALWSGSLDIFLGVLIGGLLALSPPLMLAFIFWFLYKKSKTTAFIVSFSGGGLAIPIKYYSLEENKQFQEKLTRIMDAVKG